jgi:hypothetical protein
MLGFTTQPFSLMEKNMPVQMIELEEVARMLVSDEVLEEISGKDLERIGKASSFVTAPCTGPWQSCG